MMHTTQQNSWRAETMLKKLDLSVVVEEFELINNETRPKLV